MKLLVTGAGGFVGRNLCAALRCALPEDTEIFECHRDSTREELERWCADCDFVFHLAGVNRPDDPAEFAAGNVGFTARLLETLKKQGNPCPVVLSGSVQAERDTEYGKSKRKAEELVFAYGEESGAPVLVYRLPNLFGKWCRPNYNSVVATFCHSAAHGLPLRVDEPEKELTLVYIDDLVKELIRALQGRPHKKEDGFCAVPVTSQITVGRLAETIGSFARLNDALAVPRLDDPLTKKLYATYLTYLSPENFIRDLKAHGDHRGSFAELLRTPDRGQVSVSVTRPGRTRGNHWHHTKHETFVVVHGHGLIRLRQVGQSEVVEFEVSGERLQAVEMIPGYSHSMVNLSDSEDLVALIWANEPFDPARPDTYMQEV